MVNHYYKGTSVTTLCHIADSIYLVGSYGLESMAVWNEQTDQELFTVYNNRVVSIKRVLSTSSFIIRTSKEGVKLLSIKDIATKQFSLHNLLEANDVISIYPESLDLQVTHSNVIIAAAHKIQIEGRGIKLSIKLMEVDLAGN